MKNTETPVIVERIVADIDEIVRMVRFPGWQSTSAGEREVQKALRRTLLKYHLHKDQDLFDRAYGYTAMVGLGSIRDARSRAGRAPVGRLFPSNAGRCSGRIRFQLTLHGNSSRRISRFEAESLAV